MVRKIVINVKGCGHPRVYEILQELGLLHDAKNTDYASSEDPLGNFERVGKMLKAWGIRFDTGKNLGEKVAFVFNLKQIDAVGKLLGEETPGKVEDRGKRYNDMAVYSIIGRVLFEEGK